MKLLHNRARTLRMYRMAKGHYGIGVQHSADGNLSLTLGPWVVTTSP